MANLAFNLKPQVIAPSILITILWVRQSVLQGVPVAQWIDYNINNNKKLTAEEGRFEIDFQHSKIKRFFAENLV